MYMIKEKELKQALLKGMEDTIRNAVTADTIEAFDYAIAAVEGMLFNYFGVIGLAKETVVPEADIFSE